MKLLIIFATLLIIVRAKNVEKAHDIIEDSEALASAEESKVEESLEPAESRYSYVPRLDQQSRGSGISDFNVPPFSQIGGSSPITQTFNSFTTLSPLNSFNSGVPDSLSFISPGTLSTIAPGSLSNYVASTQNGVFPSTLINSPNVFPGSSSPFTLTQPINTINSLSNIPQNFQQVIRPRNSYDSQDSGYNSPDNTQSQNSWNTQNTAPQNSWNTQNNAPQNSWNQQSSWTTTQKPVNSWNPPQNTGNGNYWSNWQQPQPTTTSTTTSVPIIKNEQYFGDNGSYKYEYEIGDGTHVAQEGYLVNANTDNESIVQKGFYSYTGGDGKVYTVTYWADDTGYHAVGDHLPKAPPVPPAIQASIDQNAKEEAEAEKKKQQELQQQQQQQQQLLLQQQQQQQQQQQLLLVQQQQQQQQQQQIYLQQQQQQQQQGGYYQQEQRPPKPLVSPQQTYYPPPSYPSSAGYGK